MPVDPESPTPVLVALVVLVALLAVRYVLSVAIRSLFPHLAQLSRRLTPETRIVRTVLRGEAMLAARFPDAAAFVRRRLSRESFTGLPMTVLLASAAIMALLFSEVTEEVLERGEIEAMDRALLQALSAVRVQILVSAFVWVTQAGDNVTLTVVTGVAAALLWAHRRLPFALGLCVTVVGSQAMLWIAKFAIDRARPDFLVGVTAASPSFPSGHATGAMAVYGFLAYVVSRSFPSGTRRFEIAFWAGVFVLMIGFSRVFLHVHYPSDVLGGLLAGSLWLIVGIAVAEWAQSRIGCPPAGDGTG